MADADAGPTQARRMVDFLNQSWTPFHAVETAVGMLTREGFEHISERESWDGLKPNGKYFFTRNASTLVAFCIGGKYNIATGGGFKIIGAHTDSPCPKLKPVSKQTKAGMLTVNCQPYGGGIWFTWFDRDLTVAGRVVYRKADGLAHELVKVSRPIMRIPTLAIHLDRTVNSGFNVNFQNHVAPVLASAIKAELNTPSPDDKDKDKNPEKKKVKEDKAVGVLQQHPLLLNILAKEIGCLPEDIVDFELQACDTQPSAIGGAHDEFVFSGRLDNLAMSYASVTALLSSLPTLAAEEGVRVVALFDHEECGSSSAQGAGSRVMSDVVARVNRQMNKAGSVTDTEEIALQRSFLVSADMAHALHPNYTDRHENQHGPLLHRGLVIKHNANQRYATNAVTASLFRECGTRRGLPTQEFVVRSDLGCGSTIGPIVSTSTGIRTVDVGIPQWSMHSVRECCGTDDVGYAVEHFDAFFSDLKDIEQPLLGEVDK